ncbi:MAG: sugar ABC transporter ATP-binding protein [Clostridiales Family XIII bacterium]|jgi:ribose transport system ATP-binding protein|nr:sugar ABC transporter ATP-binding protein [Clostridiales Family XIII bacterium]
MSTNENILEIKGLNKNFASTRANININFNLKKGEIRGLIGENGSGKSTLMSQIAGIYHPDSGEMVLKGEAYSPHTAIDANNAGIAMVVQELGVVGTLPAGVNIFLGRTKQFSKGGIISLKSLHAAANEQLEKWELPKVPLAKMSEDMMVETRKIVELARALSIDPDILLLDEITQSLSLDNRNKLYGLLRRFKEMGRSVIVISHDVEELIEITDTITVLRDGEVVGDVVSNDISPDEIKRMMVGREISGEYYRSDAAPDFRDTVVLRAENMSIENEIKDVTFEVHEGEILGLCGLSDSGIHTVGEAVYGLKKLDAGEVVLPERKKKIRSADAALKNSMAYVPKDRDHEALMIQASVRDNFTLPSLGELEGKIGYLSIGKQHKLARRMTDQLSVKTRDIFQPMSSLSGGNKQKVNLGRWLAKDIRLMVLDCPTRGVDVGVKAYIYQLMKEAKAGGIATILISDELTEVLGMADRVIVMKDGEVKEVIERGERFTEQDVIEVMI